MENKARHGKDQINKTTLSPREFSAHCQWCYRPEGFPESRIPVEEYGSLLPSGERIPSSQKNSTMFFSSQKYCSRLFAKLLPSFRRGSSSYLSDQAAGTFPRPSLDSKFSRRKKSGIDIIRTYELSHLSHREPAPRNGKLVEEP